MIPPVSADELYIAPDGRLTFRGLILLRAIVDYIVALEARVTVIDGGAP